MHGGYTLEEEGVKLIFVYFLFKQSANEPVREIRDRLYYLLISCWDDTVGEWAAHGKVGGGILACSQYGRGNGDCLDGI